jgi:hypothetical protein
LRFIFWAGAVCGWDEFPVWEEDVVVLFSVFFAGASMDSISGLGFFLQPAEVKRTATISKEIVSLILSPFAFC